MHCGTVIAVFTTREEIYLFSDGRLTNLDTGKFNDAYPKVHRLSKYTGLLTAGINMPDLPVQVSTIASRSNLLYVKDIVPIVRDVMTDIWHYLEGTNVLDKMAERKAFAFICGFDQNLIPHVYYIDNNTTPPFVIKEKSLFTGTINLEIASISTGSGEFVDPSQMLANEISKNYSNSIPLKSILLKSFNSVKLNLAKTNSWIGGQTFYSKITKKSGYTKIQ